MTPTEIPWLHAPALDSLLAGTPQDAEVLVLAGRLLRTYGAPAALCQDARGALRALGARLLDADLENTFDLRLLDAQSLAKDLRTDLEAGKALAADAVLSLLWLRDDLEGLALVTAVASRPGRGSFAPAEDLEVLHDLRDAFYGALAAFDESVAEYREPLRAAVAEVDAPTPLRALFDSDPAPWWLDALDPLWKYLREQALGPAVPLRRAFAAGSVAAGRRLRSAELEGGGRFELFIDGDGARVARVTDFRRRGRVLLRWVEGLRTVEVELAPAGPLRFEATLSPAHEGLVSAPNVAVVAAGRLWLLLGEGFGE